MISAVEALAVDERGLALGLLVAGGGADAAACLADSGRERGRAAHGSDVATDEALARWDALTAFLRQTTDEAAPFAETRHRLLELVRD